MISTIPEGKLSDFVLYFKPLNVFIVCKSFFSHYDCSRTHSNDGVTKKQQYMYIWLAPGIVGNMQSTMGCLSNLFRLVKQIC